MSFLFIHAMNTWHKGHILWLWYFIIVIILSYWDGREFQLYCFLKRRNQKRSPGHSWDSGGTLYSQWENKVPRSSGDNWVAFFLNSVLEFLSWWRWRCAGARLERKLGCDQSRSPGAQSWLAPPHKTPQCPRVLFLHPSNWYSVEGGEMRRSPLVNTVCSLDCPPDLPPGPTPFWR